MHSKLLSMIRRYEMVKPGDKVICAVSGGADSMALLWCMWLEKERLGIKVEAAHFNHHLRGEESNRDQAFVQDFCQFHDIPLHLGGGQVKAGKKGLEAAARDARYAFLRSLDGMIATAHTANDNAETVLMHLVRGSSLRGLGGITPKGPGLIRPMLDVTREEVEAFLARNWIAHVDDSSNGGDDFLRNRIRHQVMPLLIKENPSLSENLSAMAQRLRQDEAALEAASEVEFPPFVQTLRAMEPALRRRALERFLRQSGAIEPEAKHIAQAEALVMCENPSAYARFPGGIILRRCYDRLEVGKEAVVLAERELPVGGSVELPEIGMRVVCLPEKQEGICVTVRGKLHVRCRKPGDQITLAGGTKDLKKLFIDRKIPRHQRLAIPVIADDAGVVYAYGIGVNLAQRSGETVTIVFENLSGES